MVPSDGDCVVVEDLPADGSDLTIFLIASQFEDGVVGGVLWIN